MIIFSKLRIRYRAWYMTGYRRVEIGNETLITDRVAARMTGDGYKKMASLICSALDRKIFEGKGHCLSGVVMSSGRTPEIWFSEIGEDSTLITTTVSYLTPCGIRRFLPMPLYERRQQVEELNKTVPKWRRGVSNHLLKTIDH